LVFSSPDPILAFDHIAIGLEGLAKYLILVFVFSHPLSGKPAFPKRYEPTGQYVAANFTITSTLAE
jgi:hypothetical protein